MMQQKSFVCLAFSGSRLQIVELAKDKKSVKKIVGVEIPKGIIENYEVVNVKELGKVISSAWRSHGIRERSVGLVVPEFSTFAKTLEIPKIEISELDEAVRWQAQDYFPSETANMVLDWKIVDSTRTTFQVLAVAISEKVLAGYVDSVGMANLYPLVVETPSISLTRVSDHDKAGKLVIYNGREETIIIVAKGQGILGSSVVNAGMGVDVAAVAQRILRHYGSLKLEQILVGGVGIDQKVVDKLKATLKVPADWIRLKIGGVDPAALQEFLIAVSLGFKKATEPSDETTINLLPADWVKFYRDRRMKARIWSLGVSFSLVMLGCFWALAGSYFLVNQKLGEVGRAAGREGGVGQSVEKLKAETARVNSTVEKVEKILSFSKDPVGIIDTIAGLAPVGVAIDGYALDFDGGRVGVTGRAESRDKLVEFRQRLEAHEDFSKVSVPVTSLERDSDLEFDLNFVYGNILPTSKVKLQI